MNIHTWFIRVFIAFNLLSLFELSAQKFWEETAGPTGGLVQCFALDKNKKIYIGLDAGWFGNDHKGNCLFRSENSGAAWESIQITSNKDCQSIVIDTSGVIYIWQGGAGVLKSTNNGLYWQRASIGIESFYDAVLGMCKNNLLVMGHYDGVYLSTNGGLNWNLSTLSTRSHNLFIDSSDNIFALLYNEGVYKSSDHGLTWLPANNGLNIRVEALAQLNDATYYAATETGVFISTDGGFTWHFLNDSPANISSISVGSNKEIFVGSTTIGVFYSPDEGKSWNQRNDGLKNTAITCLLTLPSGDIIAGTDGDGVYINYINQFFGWKEINSGIKSTHITAFLKYNNSLFAGSQHGVLYKSTNNGDSWLRDDSTYTSQTITDFILSKKNSLFFASWFSLYVAELTDQNWQTTNRRLDGTASEFNNKISGKIYKSIDEGITWNLVSSLAVNSFANYFDTLSNIEYIFAAVGQDGVYVSMDDGETWNPISVGLNGEYIEDVETTSYGTVFASSSNRIFRSFDFGKSWETIYYGVSTIYHTTLEVASNNYLYAGFDWGKIILSTDDGNTWIDRGQNLNVNRINAITSDSLNRIYVGNWWGQIFQSIDDGEHWINISSGFIGGPAFNLYCDKNGNIYVGPYGGGVYRSSNSTFSPPPPELILPLQYVQHQPINLNLIWHNSPSAEIYTVQLSTLNTFDSTSIIINQFTTDTSLSIGPLNYNTNYYWRVSASNEFGFSQWSTIRRFKTTLLTSIEDTLAKNISYKLEQNYPNPFNPSTKISWQSPVSSHQTLKIYDVLGREVATIVDEHRDAGSYEVEFDGSQLASGIYYYQLKVEEFVQTKKMVVIK